MGSDNSPGLSLEIRELRVRYGDAIALAGVDIDVPRHRITALVGHNGSGKSTVVKSIAGVVRGGGSIRFEDENITALGPYERAQAGISIAPQNNQIFPRLTVIENLRVFATVHRLGQDQIDAALDRFPILRQRYKRLAGVLSGGERQMLSVSRALMGSPRLLLVDELSAGLAHGIVREITEFISGEVSAGLTVLCAEPNLASIKDWVHGGYVLQRGHVVGTSDGGEALHELSRKRLGVAM